MYRDAVIAEDWLGQENSNDWLVSSGRSKLIVMMSIEYGSVGKMSLCFIVWHIELQNTVNIINNKLKSLFVHTKYRQLYQITITI